MKNGLMLGGWALAALTTFVLNAEASPGGGPIGNSFLVYQGNHDQTKTAVAYNSQREEYLVVWCNDRPVNKDIYGQRVSKDGKLLGGGNVWFAISPAGGERCNPDVAYNTKHDEYLVVWDDGSKVEGQRVSSTGVLVGPTLTIAVVNPMFGSFENTAVDYSYTSDQYLLVWAYDDVSYGRGIKARALEWNGAGAPGGIFDIVPCSYDMPDDPDLAYNRARNEFLVVWAQYDVSFSQIYGQRVKMSGGPGLLGSQIPNIFGFYEETHSPSVAAIPEPPGQGQYLVVCRSFEIPTSIYAQRLGYNGNKVGSVIGVSVGFNAVRTNPAVAGSEDVKQYLVTWTYNHPNYVGIAGRTISMDGDLLSPETAIAPGDGDVSAVAAGAMGRFLVAYDDLDLDRDIYGRLWGPQFPLPLMPPLP